METEKYLRSAKSKYVRSLRTIISCKNIASKIESSLPKGWEINCNLLFDQFEVSKYGIEEEKSDAHEFKLVCKLLESFLGEEIKDRHGTALDNKVVTSLSASGYFKVDRRYMSISIHMMNPENMPDCEITFKRTWKKEAVLSDACLGIG